MAHVQSRAGERHRRRTLSDQRNAAGERERRVSTRRTNGIDQDVKLNRALCQLAEHMAELKGAAPKVIDAEIVEAA